MFEPLKTYAIVWLLTFKDAGVRYVIDSKCLKISVDFVFVDCIPVGFVIDYRASGIWHCQIINSNRVNQQ